MKQMPHTKLHAYIIHRQVVDGGLWNPLPYHLYFTKGEVRRVCYELEQEQPTCSFMWVEYVPLSKEV